MIRIQYFVIAICNFCFNGLGQKELDKTPGKQRLAGDIRGQKC